MPHLVIGSHRTRQLFSRGMFKLRRRFDRRRLPPALQPFARTGLDPVILRVHDEIGQWLALAMLQIDGLRATKPEIHEGLGPLRASLERAVQAVRDITRGQAEPTDSESLLRAIQQALANSPWADYPLQCDLDPELSKITATQAPLAVRAIGELVGNAHRHAYAVYVRLRVWCQNDALHIWVDDDGIGTADANNHHRFGLRSLHYQVASEGGHLHLHAKPGIGTRIALDFPLRHTGLVSSALLLRDRP